MISSKERAQEPEKRTESSESPNSRTPLVLADLMHTGTNEHTHLDEMNSMKEGMASISASSSSSATTTSPALESYLLDLKRVVEWLVASEQQLSDQAAIGHDVNEVKAQFQTHEVRLIYPKQAFNHKYKVFFFGFRVENFSIFTVPIRSRW